MVIKLNPVDYRLSCVEAIAALQLIQATLTLPDKHQFLFDSALIALNEIVIKDLDTPFNSNTMNI